MNYDFCYEHHNAQAELERREIQDWLTDIFEAPAVKIQARCTSKIRTHVQGELQKEGWALNVKIDQNLGLTISALSKDVGFQLQTGNMSRGPYDFLKLQHLYHMRKIEVAALAVPTKACADKIGSNVVNAERICNELELFNRVITVPILVIAFK